MHCTLTDADVRVGGRGISCGGAGPPMDRVGVRMRMCGSGGSSDDSRERAGDCKERLDDGEKDHTLGFLREHVIVSMVCSTMGHVRVISYLSYWVLLGKISKTEGGKLCSANRGCIIPCQKQSIASLAADEGLALDIGRLVGSGYPGPTPALESNFLCFTYLPETFALIVYLDSG